MSATSSGICVIFTVRAAKTPMPPPTTIAPMIHGMPAEVTRGPKMVAKTANVMPIMPNKFPRRDDAGFDSPAKLKINKIIAPM